MESNVDDGKWKKWDSCEFTFLNLMGDPTDTPLHPIPETEGTIVYIPNQFLLYDQTMDMDNGKKRKQEKQ